MIFIIVRFLLFFPREELALKRFLLILLNGYFFRFFLFLLKARLTSDFIPRLRPRDQGYGEIHDKTLIKSRTFRAVPAFSFSYGSRASFLVAAHRSRDHQAHRRKIPGGKALRQKIDLGADLAEYKLGEIQIDVQGCSEIAHFP